MYVNLVLRLLARLHGLGSLSAVWLSEKAATTRLTFGYHRYEILGAVASVVLIWAITGVLIYEAINRFINPPKHVDGGWRPLAVLHSCSSCGGHRWQPWPQCVCMPCAVRVCVGVGLLCVCVDCLRVVSAPQARSCSSRPPQACV